MGLTKVVSNGRPGEELTDRRDCKSIEAQGTR